MSGGHVNCGAASRRRTLQSGFALVAAMFLLVVLGMLAGYLVRIAGQSTETATVALLDARAYAAADSALEWAVQRAQTNPAALGCGAGGTAFPVPGPGLGDFSATVSCTATAVDEAGIAYTTYRLVATAARGASGAADFVSRAVEASVTSGP